MSNCTVTFYKDDKYKGDHKTYNNPQKVSDLNDVQWEGNKWDDMKDDTSSIKTGSKAWVRVYSKANYAGRTVLIEPNSNISDLKNLYDDNHEDDMDDTIESFQLFDHKPEVNTTNIINNFVALYPNSVHSRKDNLYNSEFYTQDVKYRVYDPTITLGDNKVNFTIKLDHIQLEKDDHATVTFSMDLKGDYLNQIQVTYEMADASQIPDWAIKLIDGAIDVAEIAAKAIFDGAEIVLTDGVGVIATVETNKVIDYTAKAITFCVDHLNTVLNAVFTYQDDGGTMYFPAVVSHSIARLILAYYQELFGPDTNSTLSFNKNYFLSGLGKSNWSTDEGSKNNLYVDFNKNSYKYRAFYPSNSFYYAKGGALSSVKIDAVTNFQKDDHLILQTIYDSSGRLFAVIGSIDIFDRNHDADYVAPVSGVLTYNDQGQMICITQNGTVNTVNYNSLEDAYKDKMTQSLNSTASKFDMNISDQQKHLVDASVEVLNAISSAIK